jgi:large subunit ribosomal protein L32
VLIEAAAMRRVQAPIRGCPRSGADHLHWRPLMAVPKRKTSKARRDERRATHKLEAPRVNTCPQCGSPKRAHRVCPTCGTYKGREVEPLRLNTP